MRPLLSALGFVLMLLGVTPLYAADQKISDRTTATTPLDGTETVGVIQGGVDKKTTINDLAIAGGVVLASTYGVLCNGVTDDTANLVTAIAAAVNKTLLLPAGSCVTTAALAIPSNVRIVGTGTGGAFATSIRPHNTAAMTFTTVHHSTIEHLMIWPSGSTQPASLITFTNANYSLFFDDVRIHYDTNDVPATAIMQFSLGGGGSANNDLVFSNLVVRTGGATTFPVILQFDDEFGSATFFNADLETGDRCIKWEGGRVTFVGLYTETCGVHALHAEPSGDAYASLTMTGGVLMSPGSSVAIAIKDGAKNVSITGTYIYPPASGYQVYVYGLSGSSNIHLNLTNPSVAFLGGAVTYDPQIVTLIAPMHPLPPARFTSINVTAGTLAAGNITGAQFTHLLSTNATPGTQTTRTAAQMIADMNALTGDTYLLRIANSGAGVFTLGAGSNVTLTGTMTVAQNTYREFIVTVDSTTTMTITSRATGVYAP